MAALVEPNVQDIPTAVGHMQLSLAVCHRQRQKLMARNDNHLVGDLDTEGIEHRYG
jgi:hypothetical protein